MVEAARQRSIPCFLAKGRRNGARQPERFWLQMEIKGQTYFYSRGILLVDTEPVQDSLGNHINGKAVELTVDKAGLKKHLSDHGFSVPKGAAFHKTEIAKALAFALTLNGPVCVKPNTGRKGILVHPDLFTPEQIISALSAVALAYPELLVEESVAGEVVRFVYFDGKVLGSIVNLPANVLGDGVHSVEQLIQTKNRNREILTAPVYEAIAIDEEVTACLAKQGLTLADVPAPSRRVTLRPTSNVSTGGDSIECLATIDASYVDIVKEACRSVPGLRIAAVDMVLAQRQAPAKHGNHWFLEFNSSPGLSNFTYPWEGKSQDLFGMILDHLTGLDPVRPSSGAPPGSQEPRSAPLTRGFQNATSHPVPLKRFCPMPSPRPSIGLFTAHHSPLVAIAPLRLRALAAEAKLQDADFIVFAQAGVTIGEPLVKGFCLGPTGWEERVLPIPHVIMNPTAPHDADSAAIFAHLRRHAPFTTRPIADKIGVAALLSRSPVGAYIPPSLDLAADNLAERLQGFLTDHPAAVIKPAKGRRGRDVGFLTQNGEGLRVRWHATTENTTVEDLCTKLAPMLADMPWTIQKFIESRARDGRVFDIRVHVHKDRTGAWALVRSYVRLSEAGLMVSNTSRGGYQGDSQHFFVSLGNEGTELARRLGLIGLATAETLDRHYERGLDELGIDFLVSPDRHPWIIEVNTHPQSRYHEFERARFAVEYALHLFAKAEM